MYLFLKAFSFMCKLKSLPLFQDDKSCLMFLLLTFGCFFFTFEIFEPFGINSSCKYKM